MIDCRRMVEYLGIADDSKSRALAIAIPLFWIEFTTGLAEVRSSTPAFAP
jgi:hypothetical protein